MALQFRKNNDSVFLHDISAIQLKTVGRRTQSDGHTALPP